MPATTQALLDVQEENALEHLNQHVKELSKRGIVASAAVRRGDPAQMIVKAAEQSEADLIALSTHGKSGIGAFWARSVAPKVAQRTKTPVLLIPLAESA
jgi:universal stress protein A